MGLVSSDRQRQFGTPTLRRTCSVSPAYLYLKKRRNPLSPGEYVASYPSWAELPYFLLIAHDKVSPRAVFQNWCSINFDRNVSGFRLAVVDYQEC